MMKKMNHMVSTAILGLGLAMAAVPVAFADTTTGVTATPINTIRQDEVLGAQWMTKNALTTAHSWTLISAYAAGKPDATATWSSASIAKLKTSTDYARVILGMLAANFNPHNYNGQNLVAKLASVQLQTGVNAGKFADNIDGSGTTLVNSQMWAIIALEDAGGATYRRTAAANWLIARQNKDGGWGYQAGSSDVDDTATALVALSLLGDDVQTPAVVKALAYVKTQQATNGGFGSADSNGKISADSDSTGVTVDALVALGENPTHWQQTGGTSISALVGFGDAKSGGFLFDNTGTEYSGVNAYSTRDSILGLSAYTTGKSIYQRLHWQNISSLNSYWTKVQAAGGVWVDHSWLGWSSVKTIAVAGTHVNALNIYWKNIEKSHGLWHNHVWVSWNNQLAAEALAASYGWDSVAVNQLG